MNYNHPPLFKSDFTSPAPVYSVDGRRIGLVSEYTGSMAFGRAWLSTGVGPVIILYAHGARKRAIMESN